MDNPSYPPPAEPPLTPAPTAPAASSRDWMAYTSLGLGIVNLCAWFIPICGGPLTIVGLVLGVLGLNSTKRGLAIAGIVLCGLALCATLVNAVAGAYLGMQDWTQFLPQQ